MLIHRAMNGDKKIVLCSSQRSGMFGYDMLLRFKIFCTGTNKTNGRKERQSKGRRFAAIHTLRCRCFYFRFPVADVSRSHGRPASTAVMFEVEYLLILTHFFLICHWLPFTSYVLRCARLIMSLLRSTGLRLHVTFYL
jgi:hypothetical protein